MAMTLTKENVTTLISLGNYFVVDKYGFEVDGHPIFNIEMQVTFKTEAERVGKLLKLFGSVWQLTGHGTWLNGLAVMFVAPCGTKEIGLFDTEVFPADKFYTFVRTYEVYARNFSDQIKLKMNSPHQTTVGSQTDNNKTPAACSEIPEGSSPSLTKRNEENISVPTQDHLCCNHDGVDLSLLKSFDARKEIAESLPGITAKVPDAGILIPRPNGVAARISLPATEEVRPGEPNTSSAFKPSELDGTVELIDERMNRARLDNGKWVCLASGIANIELNSRYRFTTSSQPSTERVIINNVRDEPLRILKQGDLVPSNA